jgi:hypothetical protein
LNLALQYLKNHKYKLATRKVEEAELWPERLGVGAPYPDMINHTLEDDIQQLINGTQKGKKLQDSEIDELLKKINFTIRDERN